MLWMSPPIDRYLELSSLSARMADAARSGDWERLDLLERRVSELRARRGDGPEADGEVGGAQVGGLICRILDDDAEVRRHTEPWSEQLRLLLAGHLSGWHLAPDSPPGGDGNPDGGR
jgi:flagellar protein FliT